MRLGLASSALLLSVVLPFWGAGPAQAGNSAKDFVYGQGRFNRSCPPPAEIRGRGLRAALPGRLPGYRPHLPLQEHESLRPPPVRGDDPDVVNATLGLPFRHRIESVPA